jgi:uncharacterized membrane protein YGL010W
MSPRLERWFGEYHAYHRDPVNVAIHKVAVPAILFHIVAMLDWLSLPVRVAGVPLGLGLVAAVAVGAWYLFVCPRYAAVLVPFAIGCAVVGRMVPRPVVVGVAAVAWTAQFVGHASFERRAPAFTDNLVQLLVGPAYVVALMMGDWPPASERDDGGRQGDSDRHRGQPGE